MPPIDVYRIGDMHFVQDGHHRVSIAMATGQTTIDAYVTEVLTQVPAKGIRRRGDLLMKSYERMPLPGAAVRAGLHQDQGHRPLVVRGTGGGGGGLGFSG